MTYITHNAKQSHILVDLFITLVKSMYVFRWESRQYDIIIIECYC